MAVLSRRTVLSALKHLPGWSITGKGIHKRYTFQDFKEAIGFVNSVADLAESANHHPDITIRRRRVDLSLWTHQAGGLTKKDLELAKKIEQLLAA